MNELATLLLQLLVSGQRVEDVVNDPLEQWTAAPLESDDAFGGCRMQSSNAEEDEENADDSEPVVPMTLRDERAAAQALKIFVQENQRTAAMRPYLEPIQALSREMEAMTVSARTQQTTMHRFFQPVRASDSVSPSAGTKAD